MHSVEGSLAAALCLGLAGCDVARLPSEGSRLEELRSWDTELTAEGRPRVEWVKSEGELPADMLSLTLVARGDTAARLVFEIRDTEERLLVDPTGSEWSPNRALSSRGVTVAMLPSASGSLPLGRNFRVAAHLAEPLPGTGLPNITAFVKRASGEAGGVPHVQDLPLVLVAIGDKRPDPAKLGRALYELTDIWARAGVQIRPLPLLHRTDPTFTRFERLVLDSALGSDSPELGKLLALSEEVAADPGLENVAMSDPPLVLFLVADILAGPGMGVWALSGGVPVPPLLGTRRSGVAVNASVIELDPSRAAQVMAHEIGHALGLYHTTEGGFIRRNAESAPEAIHDQLDDTPACPADADSGAKDGVLTPSECEGHDSRNLMFWAATRVSTHLTAGQGDIARRSALTR